MKEGWKIQLIGEIAEVTDYVANGSFATLRENVTYLDEPSYAVLVRLADYSSNFDSSKFVYVNEHAYNFLAKSKLFGGEIIMSNVGSIGKEFICPDLLMPMTLAPNSIVIKTPFNYFYYYYFKSNRFQEDLKSISSQTALPKFNKTQFKKLQIPVPPLSEQQQIVEELDLLSGIIEKKKEQLKELDNLAQSIFYEMFGDPVANEKGWEKKKLIETVTETCSISYGIVQPGDGEEEGVPVVRPVDMIDTWVYNKGLKLTTKEISDSYKRTILKRKRTFSMCPWNYRNCFFGFRRIKRVQCYKRNHTT